MKERSFKLHMLFCNYFYFHYIMLVECQDQFSITMNNEIEN